LIREYVETALQDLVRQKLRTVLTMLGIIFGVGAVISMLSIGAGAQEEALRVIDAMGLRNVIVREKPVDDEELYTIRERSLGLSLADVEGVRAVARDVVAASPVTRVRVDRVLGDSGRSEAQVLGVGAQHPRLKNLRVARGSFFDPTEEATFQRVAVLGHRAARELFAFDDPLGRAIKVNDVWFSVVGTLEPQNVEQETFQGVAVDSPDATVFVPVSTALKMFDRDKLESELDEIVFQLRSGASVEDNAVLIASTISELHGGEPDTSLVVPQDLLEQSRETRRIFNIVMGGIAGISLLVGGIGIMNIMLASVMERTREIGIRRAIGAKRSDIVAQFLCEAVLISLLGGVTGILLGFAISSGVSLYSEWNTVVTGFSIFLAFGFSVAVGVVFGTYPALRASRLDPIEALRTI
jgi:putative ABC transport system permease protein